MNRRFVLKSGAGFAATLATAREVFGGSAALQNGPEDKYALQVFRPKEWRPFSEDMLFRLGRELSLTPYVPPEQTVPQEYRELTYDKYRNIRFKKNCALWADDSLNFTVELFHAGYIYTTPVKLFAVENGMTGELRYDRNLFTFGPEVPPPPEGSNSGFSGFRIHAAVTRPGVSDEFAVFQGASYFRGRASGQDYGLSARGLAIGTAQPGGDEFPVFRTFWIQKPAPGADSVTIFALLDSVSTTGIYKVVISRMHNTVMDITCTLFPRRTIAYPGIAPLTSMFFFAPSINRRVDEVRQRVHDSDGLSILTGKGEAIWRPLTNPSRIEFSVFSDTAMRGFGLLQRERRPDRYQDFDARYGDRPSAWVEPLGEWGEGTVELVELPTANEYADNIVAFWKPAIELAPGKSYSFPYRLTWCYEPPAKTGVATVVQTLAGAASTPGHRLFYVDFAGTENLSLFDEDSKPYENRLKSVELNANTGAIVNAALRINKISGGHRLGFEYAPAPNSTGADLRCALVSEGKPVSEIWIYRWTA